MQFTSIMQTKFKNLHALCQEKMQFTTNLRIEIINLQASCRLHQVSYKITLYQTSNYRLSKVKRFVF